MARLRVVSWLRAATLTFPADSPGQWCYERAFDTRYSGGAAPAFHRFPWLPFAINCNSKLSTTKRAGKREDHRAANQYR